MIQCRTTMRSKRPHMPRIKANMLALLLYGLLPGNMAPAFADQSRLAGDYTVYYSAFTTDTLPRSVAQAYGIQRSQNRGLLNISVLKKVMGTTAQPARARISGTATNLNAQLRELNVREISEDGAVYYLTEFPVGNDETLNFNLTIRPVDSDQTIDLTFQQQFYTH